MGDSNFIEKSTIYVEAKPVSGKEEQKEYIKLFEDTFMKEIQKLKRI